MRSHHIQVTKTARYFTLGEMNENTREVWLVLHGYAQLASDFLASFEPLINNERLIVAPEGLSRFYAKGFGGKPAATWMTSEDRDAEISDYLNYLENLYRTINPQPHINITILGFSQGVATASRFIHHTTLPVHRFLICSGEIAAELTNPVSTKISSTEVVYITGINDPLIKPDKHKQVYELMHRLKARIIEFDGGHEINAAVIDQLSHF